MNKTKGKKILSLVLTFCMVLSLLPSMAFAAEINTTGTTTLQEGTDSGNIVLTATDGTFADPATKENFTLSDTALTVQSVEISQITSEKDTATLTITGTPTKAGDLTVTVKKEAFEPQAAENATATVQIKAKAEPAKTSPLTALTVSNGSEVTITPSDLGTQSEPVALTSTLNANAESFTITATFGEATAKYSTDSMEQAESSEKTLTSGSASDAINTEAAGGDTIVYIYVEGSDQQTKAYYKLTVTNPAKEEPAKTAQPTFEQTTVTAAENNQSAVFTVTNTEAYEGKEITVEVYKGADFSEKDETVTGKYADGQLTLTFQEAISAQQTYQVTFKAGEDEASDKSETLTVEVYKKTTVTPQPQAEGAFEEIVAEAGNKTAKVGVQNIDAYETPDNITVEVYQDTDGQKGEKADSVTGKYTETEEAGTLTLTFNEALTKVTTYWITFQDEGSSASEPVKLVVQPVTAQPTITEVTAKSEDNKTATFTVTNTQDYAEGGSVAVTLYTDANGEDEATGVEGTYNLDGTLTLTFTNTLDADQKLYAAFTYTPEGDGAQAWAPSPVSAELTVQYTPTTAMPKLEGQETVEITCTSKTSAEIALTNASAYKSTPEVKVYSQATGGEAVKNPTAKYADGKITLTFTSPIEAQQTYYISMTEDQKLESARLKVIVNPYQAETKNGIESVAATITDNTVTAEKVNSEADGTTPEKAIKWQFNILEEDLTKLTSVKLTMDSKLSKVHYLASATDDISDGETINSEGTNSEGTVTIESLNFSTNPYLYVKVTSEAGVDCFYLITVDALNVKAADAKTEAALGDYTSQLTDANLGTTALDEASKKVMDQAILNAIAADTTLADQMENEGDKDTHAAGTVWGELYEANPSVSGETITYFYVPYIDLQVETYDADSKTLTMDITPKYSVIATTATSFNDAKWEGQSGVSREQINAVQLSTGNTVDLTNVTIEIPVPSAIGGDGATVYVIHDGTDSWQCTVASSKVSVTVPSFSTFTLQSKATGAAVIGGKVYSTVQAAVDAVTNGGTITLTSKATQDELKALKAPTQLANENTFTIAAGDSKLTVGESDVIFTDTTEDNVTYKATMGSSGKVTISTTQLYDIKITTTGSGSITANPNPAAKEAEVTLTVSGTLKGELKVVNYNTDEKIEATTTDNGKTYTFTMPDSTVIITAEFESSGGGHRGSGSASSSNSVTSEKTTNGSFTVSDKNAAAGDTVKVTPKADKGYVVDEVIVTDDNGRSVRVKDNGDGTYSFVMPEKAAQPVTVNVTFKKEVIEKEVPTVTFNDVSANAWYREAVDYVVANGLMNGIDDETFAPNATTTRGMVVTILYRLEGEPGVTRNLPFADVAAGTWYSDAINWASTNGIVTGYDENTFGPDDSVTRAQMAAILYRYAELKGYNVSRLADLAGYADAAAIGSWADAAMRWAVAEGLIEGTASDTLSPNGNSTRAQIATILMRFCESVAK